MRISPSALTRRPGSPPTESLCSYASPRSTRFPRLVSRPHKVPSTDMQPIPMSQLEEAAYWVDSHIDGHHICLFWGVRTGRSRSAAIAHLCWREGFSLRDAVEHVARRKPDIRAFPGLLSALSAFDPSSNEIGEAPNGPSWLMPLPGRKREHFFPS